MVACDFDLNITFFSTGGEGFATDSRVLKSAMSKSFQFPHNKFYLVDGGYTDTPSFLAPYGGVRYHLKEFGSGRQRLQNSKELFNYRHAVLRNHVEWALGVLKKRFSILKVAIFHKLKNQVKIPIAAAIFHNIIKSLDGDEEWLDDQPDNINLLNFVALLDGEQVNDPRSAHGNTLRDVIAQEMWVQYQHVY
jgi:hypothetical protein